VTRTQGRMGYKDARDMLRELCPWLDTLGMTIWVHHWISNGMDFEDELIKLALETDPDGD
jgi:hypothetical protein